MSMENPYRSLQFGPTKLLPEQCIPVAAGKELVLGNRFAIAAAHPSHYVVNERIADGVLRAQRESSQNPQAPAEMVLHRVNRIEGNDAKAQHEQRLVQLSATRRIEIPNALRSFRIQNVPVAVVATPYGYLTTYETQGNQEIPTGTYTLTEYFGALNAEQTVEAIREQNRIVDPRAIAQIILNVGTTLAVAHSMGYVHRDVKPSNIQLRNFDPRSTGYPQDYAALTDWEDAYRGA